MAQKSGPDSRHRRRIRTTGARVWIPAQLAVLNARRCALACSNGGRWVDGVVFQYSFGTERYKQFPNCSELAAMVLQAGDRLEIGVYSDNR